MSNAVPTVTDDAATDFDHPAVRPVQKLGLAQQLLADPGTKIVRLGVRHFFVATIFLDPSQRDRRGRPNRWLRYVTDLLAHHLATIDSRSGCGGGV